MKKKKNMKINEIWNNDMRSRNEKNTSKKIEAADNK